MGCNGSKSVAAVFSTDDPVDNNTETVPMDDGDASITRPVTPLLQPVPPSMAFEIPFDDDSSKSGDSTISIVKRHPPRRLQRLEQMQQQQSPISLEELNERQQEAENRRLQFLQLRAQSAKRKYAIRNNNNIDDDDGLVEEDSTSNIIAT